MTDPEERERDLMDVDPCGTSLTGGVPVDPPEPREECPTCHGTRGGRHPDGQWEDCPRCVVDGAWPPSAAGGVVQPPADREVEGLRMEVEVIDVLRAGYDEDADRQVVEVVGSDGGPGGFNLFLLATGVENEWRGKRFVLMLRPVGAAGGEGTDGD